ncbi:MAG TPA: hypothetical protein VFS21_03915 [Roseiflexaceae bacterium]|nr:hypothetical protein [Roseiflexaceae bacterium]
MRQRTAMRLRKPDAAEDVATPASLFSSDWSAPTRPAREASGPEQQSEQDAYGPVAGHSFSQIPLFSSEHSQPGGAPQHGPVIQAKLRVGGNDTPEELEAEQAADLVTQEQAAPLSFAESPAAIQRSPGTEAVDKDEKTVDPEQIKEALKVSAEAQGAKTEEQSAVPAPQNMGEIYDAMRSGGREIKIYQLSGGGLVMLLDGSDPVDFKGINNLWKNAFLSRFDIKSTYRTASELVIEQLGKSFAGSDIHLVGYSQGGLIAQNLSARPKLFEENGLNLVSCSTYGTPDMMPWNRNRKVDYSRNFDATGDLVSNLGIPSDWLFLPGMLTVAPAMLAAGIYTHVTAYGDKDTDIRQEMESTATPYQSETWTLVDWFSDGEGFDGYRQRHGLEDKSKEPQGGGKSEGAEGAPGTKIEEPDSP